MVRFVVRPKKNFLFLNNKTHFRRLGESTKSSMTSYMENIYVLEDYTALKIWISGD